jgi:flagellar protein FliS
MRDPVRSYRESAVRGASPIGLIVILYGEIVRSIRRAQRSLASGSIEQRSNALTHVAEVIGYLQSILDFERGGAVARELSQFYGLMRAQVFEVNTSPTHEGLESLANQFEKVAGAWEQADRAATQQAESPANVATDILSSAITRKKDHPADGRLVALGR